MRRKHVPCPAYYYELVKDVDGNPVAIQMLEEDVLCTSIILHAQDGISSMLETVLPELREVARSIYRKGYEQAQLDMRFALGLEVNDPKNPL